MGEVRRLRLFKGWINKQVDSSWSDANHQGKAKPAIGGVQQQGGQFALVVVGENQVEIGDNGAGDDLLGAAIVESDQLVNTAGGFGGEAEVAGEGGLAIEVEQQDALPASARMPPRLAATVVFPTPPLVERIHRTCMTLASMIPIRNMKTAHSANQTDGWARVYALSLPTHNQTMASGYRNLAPRPGLEPGTQ